MAIVHSQMLKNSAQTGFLLECTFGDTRLCITMLSRQYYLSTA
jgi:hypothetical protein